ncbi:MAG: tRNA-intron lyase [archaeon]|nr:tRNA-intron lyase [archaeon]
MQNTLVNNKVLVQDNKLKSQLIQKGFGEKTATEFVLDLVEALYLMQKQKLEITDSDEKKVSEKQLLALGEKKLKEFYNVFIVYSDLRERGYVPKTGFKFGFHLRVYPKGKKQGEAHTQWVINVSTQNTKLSMTELSRMVRLSGNIKTTILQAVVDSENDINYYSLDRVTP